MSVCVGCCIEMSLSVEQQQQQMLVAHFQLNFLYIMHILFNFYDFATESGNNEMTVRTKDMQTEVSRQETGGISWSALFNLFANI